MFNKQLIFLVAGDSWSHFCSPGWTTIHCRKLAFPLMASTIVLLIAVLLLTRTSAMAPSAPSSADRSSPRNWQSWSIILYLSVWLYSKREYLHDIQLGLIPLAVILGGIAGLIYLEPDLSATITIFLLGGLLFFLAGGELRQIVLFCLVALVAGWVVVQFSPTGRAAAWPLTWPV